MLPRSLRLLIFSACIFIFVYMLSAYKKQLGFGFKNVAVGSIICISFGLSIAGLILGFDEWRVGRTAKVLISLIGNGLVVTLFLWAIAYSVIRGM